jgi:1-acyl-sn-glycerol-3-phosphate acyltransferase
LALFSKKWAYRACHAFCAYVIWSVRMLCGLKVEIRGTPPTGGAVVASKHQSFFDIIVIFNAVPEGKFIMKRELLRTPFVGQYATRIGCIPVDRGKKGAAISKLKMDVARELGDEGQLIIYPQGTRVAPGVNAEYKVGTGLLYAQLGFPCTPTATNIGVFWPKRSILRKRGTAVVDFLPVIEPGMGVKDFMARIETEIETVSEELLDEAGFVRPV